MAAQSAGILLYKSCEGRLVVLLVHPGGPFWRAKDLGAWSIPKGEPAAGEEPEATARREFAEELGSAVTGDLHPLGKIRQRGGKQVEAFALEGDFDVDSLSGNSFEMEWPPRSGRRQSFPRSIVRHGSTCRRRVARFSSASNRCSIGSRDSWPMATWPKRGID